MSTYSIAELLPQGESRSFAESALVLTASSALLMHPERVRRLIHRYGRGNLYTSSGLVFPDSPRTRENLVRHYPRVLLYSDEGGMSLITTASLREPARRKALKRDKREHDLEVRAMRADRADRERERMFSEQQTQPSPKHQGKANSHADIGQYNTSKYPRTYLSEYTPKSTTRLSIIRVAI